MDVREDVDVFFHTVDTIQMTVEVFRNTPNILVKVFAMFKWECAFTVFCAENNVVENLTVTGRHDVFLYPLVPLCFANGYSYSALAGLAR